LKTNTVEWQKKYKEAQDATHYVAVRLGSPSAALSASGIAASLTGPGIIVSALLGSLGAICGACSAGLTGLGETLSLKVTKHEKIYSLAISERNSINTLVSKSLNF